MTVSVTPRCELRVQAISKQIDTRLEEITAESEGFAGQFYESFATEFAGIEVGDIAQTEAEIEGFGRYYKATIEENPSTKAILTE